MMKIDERDDDTSCWNKARDTELVFVLLGRDAAAPSTIRHWVGVRINLGKNKKTDPEIIDALALADRMDAERSATRAQIEMPQVSP